MKRYVCGFDKNGLFIGGCVYKNQQSLTRPAMLNGAVFLSELVDEATFDLYKRGYYRNPTGVPTAPKKIEPTPEELVAHALEQAKAERARAVAALTVEVDGMTFDGDEKAQERMARAVLMAESMDEETEWVLADNSVVVVTASQLRRACRAAGKAQTTLWVKPYTS